MTAGHRQSVAVCQKGVVIAVGDVGVAPGIVVHLDRGTVEGAVGDADGPVLGIPMVDVQGPTAQRAVPQAQTGKGAIGVAVRSHIAAVEETIREIVTGNIASVATAPKLAIRRFHLEVTVVVAKMVAVRAEHRAAGELQLGRGGVGGIGRPTGHPTRAIAGAAVALLDRVDSDPIARSRGRAVKTGGPQVAQLDAMPGVLPPRGGAKPPGHCTRVERQVRIGRHAAEDVVQRIVMKTEAGDPRVPGRLRGKCRLHR